MNTLIKKNKYLILFVFIVGLLFLVQGIDIQWDTSRVNTKSFSQNLTKKEKLIDDIIDSLFYHVNNQNLATWVDMNSIKLDYLNKEKGLVFLVFNKNSLLYWTSNEVVVPNDSVWLQKPFSKNGNSYYEVRKKSNSSYKVVGLIDIMQAYPYENKFLRNGFHKSFKLDENHSLVIESNAKSNAIKNSENEYLFTLVKEVGYGKSNKDVFLVFLFLLAFFFIFMFGRDKFNKTKFSYTQYIIFALALIAFRVLMQWLEFPGFLYELKVFQPQYFAFSNLFPSLGQLLITLVLFGYLIFVFYTKVNLNSFLNLNQQSKLGTSFLWVFVLISYGIFSFRIFQHLIIDSNFQFEAYDVLNLSLFSFIGYFLILILFIGFILLVDKFCSQIKGHVHPTRVFLIIVGLSFVFLIICIVTRNQKYIFPIFGMVLILSYWVYMRLSYTARFGMLVVLIALFSAYSTYFIRQENFKKRIEESKVIAVNMAREQDPVTEVVLTEIIETIQQDTILKSFLENEWFNFNEMAEYIRKTYFTGYLQRYNMQLTVCNRLDSVLLDENGQVWQYCYGFFDDLLKTDGAETGIQGLYYLKDLSGGLNYFIRTEIDLSDQWENITLFFELTTRPNIKVLGYPELLLEKPVSAYDLNNKLSYAKYKGSRLISRSGDFPYALNRSVYASFDKEFSFFQQEEYDHLLYNSEDQHTVIISFPTVRFYNTIISFTYIFFFLLIQTTLLLIIGNRFAPILNFHNNIKNRIVFSMMLILLISLFFVGGGTIMYTYNRFEKGQIDILSEKIQSVVVELENKFAESKDIHTVPTDYINSLLVKFSNVFYSDINLYDASGNLVGTSRKEIFDRDLTSTKMNAIAFRELVLEKKARVVHKERIGEMEYYSAYVPFLNKENELLAYLNLPYFTKEVLLRQELLMVVVAVINIYAFLLIISIAIAVYISSRLTEPLRMVQQRIRNIDLSIENERIDYEGHDEIGELVFEYNRMLGELDKSAKLLARSERESAWREMAKQIAHEIKNPLTPMKLTIQLLDKSLKNNDTDFKTRFDRSSQTLIQQIDSLSSIASAFSQFAHIPSQRLEKVNVVERLNRSTELFKECSFAKLVLKYDETQQLFVKADNDRMLQVFNNLMKNALQSIPNTREGLVVVDVLVKIENVVVEMSDNGVGIDEEMKDKLFQPNFTTKTSGTGLGLAIVKNIVEELGGKIWFTSELDKGSSFFVSLPLYKD